MTSALDDIAFLANSENRVQVLETLVDGPRGRDGVRDRVDASRVTVARILRECEARGWVSRAGGEYEATPLGEWVSGAFDRLIEEVEAGRRLREGLQWFPSDQLTFDVRCLRDAEVVLAREHDATAVVRRIVEFHRSGDRIRGVSRVAAPVFVENQWELTVNGDARLELVVTPGALDVVRSHPPSVRRFREMLDEENTDCFVHDGIPISVGIVDGTVGINLVDEDGVLRGGLVSENETVRAWAVDLFERCRGRARPVGPEEITA
jgi:predicted transcriptional regulator